ncbi:hypothetical protein L596_009958 [Steinernema carpocapsae]|uniref:Uncharacterized protein n=1 Tax=Steinernema carpocapsae TaxID=34508 RepID=A0A4U5PI66_STECR|nr:hypothetical protein L596_009958 [Steinernema carpocapsae]
MEPNDLQQPVQALSYSLRPTIDVLNYAKYVFALSFLAWAAACTLIGFSIDLAFWFLPITGTLFYGLMFLHFLTQKREFYKFYLVGNFTIFQGILAVMFGITGFVGFVKIFSNHPSYNYYYNCGSLQTQIRNNVILALVSWVFSGVYAIFTVFFWHHYQFLRIEDKKNQPVLGANTRLNDLSFENPYKKMALPKGFALDVPQLIRFVFLGNLANFITVITVFFVLLYYRYTWVGTIPLFFGLPYYVLFPLSFVERFENNRKLFVSAHAGFSVFFGVILGIVGLVFIVLTFIDGAVNMLIALGAILSSAGFLFASFFNYFYLMYLTYQENYGSRFFHNNLCEAAKKENEGFANIHGQSQKPLSHLI